MYGAREHQSSLSVEWTYGTIDFNRSNGCRLGSNDTRDCNCGTEEPDCFLTDANSYVLFTLLFAPLLMSSANCFRRTKTRNGPCGRRFPGNDKVKQW